MGANQGGKPAIFSPVLVMLWAMFKTFETLTSFKTSAQIANRRRLVVFIGSFLLLAGVGLIWCYARPAIYLATARVQINPGQVQVEASVAGGGTQGASVNRNLLSEIQVLTSRTLVQEVMGGLAPALKQRVAELKPEPLTALQAGLEANLANGTDVVEVSSRGPYPELAASLVNELIALYTTKLEKSYGATAGDSLNQINEEVEKLTQKVDDKRRELEEFRQRNNIVSIEREENEILGRVKGQTDALNKAQERLAIAEGKLRAMNEGQGAKRAVSTGNRTNATLDNLELRASAIREEIAELNRLYTPAYLALDPKFRALKIRQSDIENQITAQRQTAKAEVQNNQSAALDDAREEVSAAKSAADRLRGQIGASRGNLSAFSARFNQFQMLSKDVAPMEALLRDATQRKARMEATERARRPSVRLIEAAVTPREPWQPQYLRDAGLVVLGSLLAAVLAMFLVELFNREEVVPTMIVAQPGMTSAPMYGSGAPGLAHAGAAVPRLAARPVSESGPGPATAFLAGPPLNAPRELLDEELQVILANASEPVKRFVHLLLRGLRPAEALALRGSDVDTDRWTLNVTGDHARAVPVDEALLAWLAQHPVAPAQALVGDLGVSSQADVHLEAAFKAPTLAELTTGLLYAAHDASLDQPAEVTPEAVWHTAVAHLARQGLRLSDLAKWLGHLSTEQATLYSALAPQGTRLGPDQVRVLMPAARTLGA